ncbi:AfsR/SARP family transcriptional regulator [Acrocarpospora macrocephala]|uniref:AfsR/SARP family transcriptional regulator n=1 Tax=Acrocarpospora macrocephala TaxID=150177 RepID=UPI0012D2CF6D|nr:AfsR/SARP family transcriptional regulator [Acrocarpospora macrocephala]
MPNRGWEFRVLGPVEVGQGDTTITLARRAQRCLLGLLLLDAGRVVPVGRLLELLWDDDPPVNARGILHSHVARLRGTLDPDRTGSRGFRLLRQGDGYLAETDVGAVDVHRFRDLVGRARRSAGPGGRSRLLTDALACWRGPLLADAATDRLRDRLGVGLEELRLAAIEARAEAELECGRHRELLPELADLVRQHPLRERLIRAYMIALYRDGRRPDALAGYRRARGDFVRELGLEPTRELHELHDRMARADPSLHFEPSKASARRWSWRGAPSGTPRAPGYQPV